MHQSSIHPKRYPFIMMPQPYHRFNSLKASHAYFTQHPNLTKRHSLDTRPTHYCNKPSFDNLQQLALVTQPKWTSKGHLPKNVKPHPQETVKIKYYWGSSKRGENKGKNGKGKGGWSEASRNVEKKKKDISRSKCDQAGKMNKSDRISIKHQITNGKSNDSLKDRKDVKSLKMAKSILNSTMLTKRQSDSSKEQPYFLLLVKLKDVLAKYQKKVEKLTHEKEYYRLKLKKVRRKKGNMV